MLGWRRSGLSPTPSWGAGCRRSNGSARNSSSMVKKPANASSTACAQAATSNSRPRVSTSARLDHADSSHTHRSSDPSWADHAAAAR